MQKHLTLFFSALFMLIACKSEQKPNNLIEKDKMIKLMADIHLVDGSLAAQMIPDSLYKYGTGKYRLLFKQYGVDSGMVKKSLRYYAAKPNELIEIYNGIEKIITGKTDSLSKVQHKADADEVKKMKAKAKLLEKQGLITKKRVMDSLRRDSVIKAKLLNRIRPGQIK